MEGKEVKRIFPGLYKVYWKEGGSSLAAIGMTEDGGHWLAPCNWVSPDNKGKAWGEVQSVRLIREAE